MINLFKRKEPVAYCTIDGNKLCPYPGMTDEDLADYQEFEKRFRRIIKEEQKRHDNAGEFLKVIMGLSCLIVFVIISALSLFE